MPSTTFLAATRRRRTLWTALAVLVAVLALSGLSCRSGTEGSPPPRAESRPSGPANEVRPFLRGVGLGLFATDADYNYETLLQEVAAHGATDVLLVVPYYQLDVKASDIGPRTGFSPSLPTVERTLRQAKGLGLRAAVLPIVRLERRTRTEWRGRIQPKQGVEAWFEAYSHFVLPLADVAQRGGAVRFGVGSELLSLERHESHWRKLIAKVRARFDGRLFYSANWDHFDPIRFWDALDEAAVTAYFELTRHEGPVTDEALDAAWARPRLDLARLSARLGKPLFISEVGYPSIVTGARYPWDETRRAPLDQALQAQLYRAFCRNFSPAAAVDGAFFWNWFGFGGPQDSGYTPRGKPAALDMKRCLEQTDWDKRVPPKGIPHSPQQ